MSNGFVAGFLKSDGLLQEEAQAPEPCKLADDDGSLPAIVDDGGHLVKSELDRRLTKLRELVPADDPMWTEAILEWQRQDLHFAEMRKFLTPMWDKHVAVPRWADLIQIMLVLAPDALPHILRGWKGPSEPLLKALAFFEKGARPATKGMVDWDYTRAKRARPVSAHPIPEAVSLGEVLASPARQILQNALEHSRKAQEAAEAAATSASETEQRVQRVARDTSARQLKFQHDLRSECANLDARRKKEAAALEAQVGMLTEQLDRQRQVIEQVAATGNAQMADQLRQVVGATEAQLAAVQAQASAMHAEIHQAVSQVAAEVAPQLHTTLMQMMDQAEKRSNARVEESLLKVGEQQRADANSMRAWIGTEMDSLRREREALQALAGRSDPQQKEMLEGMMAEMDRRLASSLTKELADLRMKLEQATEAERAFIRRRLDDTKADLKRTLARQGPTHRPPPRGPPDGTEPSMRPRAPPRRGNPSRDLWESSSDSFESEAGDRPWRVTSGYETAYTERDIPLIDEIEFYLRGRNALKFWSDQGVGSTEERTLAFRANFSRLITMRLTGQLKGQATEVMALATALCRDYARGGVSEETARTFSKQASFVISSAQYTVKRAVAMADLQRRTRMDKHYERLVRASAGVVDPVATQGLRKSREQDQVRPLEERRPNGGAPAGAAAAGATRTGQGRGRGGGRSGPEHGK